MELVLTVLITPLLIAAGSLGARFWGPLVGGWLIAFPVTMGPLVFFTGATAGPAAGAHAAEGAVAGNVSIAVFCLAYSFLARRGRRWPACLAIGLAAFLAASILLLPFVALPVGILFVAVLAALRAAHSAMPVPLVPVVPQPSIPMDLPVRMGVGALVVLAVALLIPIVGSDAGGILSMVPVTTSVVSVFAQRADGPDAAFGVQRGLLVGLVGTAAFATTVSVAIVPLSLVVAFVLATVAVVAVQAVALAWIRRGGPPVETRVADGNRSVRAG